MIERTLIECKLCSRSRYCGPQGSARYQGRADPGQNATQTARPIAAGAAYR